MAVSERSELFLASCNLLGTPMVAQRRLRGPLLVDVCRDIVKYSSVAPENAPRRHVGNEFPPKGEVVVARNPF